MDVNPYMALAVNGFATGLGVISAQHFYQLILKKRIVGMTLKLGRYKKKLLGVK